MTRDDIKAEFDRFIEFPEGSPRTMVTVASTLFFAEHIARMATSSEREACARVCDPEPSPPNEAYTVLNNKATMRRCAAAIPARSQK